MPSWNARGQLSCFEVVLHLSTDLVVSGHKVQAESWMGRMLPAVCGWVLFHGILGNTGSSLSWHFGKHRVVFFMAFWETQGVLFHGILGNMGMSFSWHFGKHRYVFSWNFGNHREFFFMAFWETQRVPFHGIFQNTGSSFSWHLLKHGELFFMAFGETQGVFFHQFPDHEVPLKKDNSSVMR